ncbi:MAG TPA: hypothetical protein VJT73_10545, partial [Polyangiaceae bacterium]|nr:hypothetical protein [Polyangiaceae bacterium]
MPRFARGAALTLATTATFAAALGAAVVLHLDTRLARVVAASAVTSVLTKTFLGRVVLETIDHVDANGFSGASARVYDPEGTCVLAVRGLAGRASLVDVARRLLGGGDIDLEIAYARVEHAEVHLIAGADGVPSLARAFAPRPSSGPPTAGPSPRVRVWLPHVEVASAHGSGAILGLSNLDVDLSNVSGSVLAGTERTSIRMKRYGASVRGLTAGALQGTADTRIEIPSSSGKSLSLWAVLDGYMGEVQVNARVGLDGDQFSATADAPFARPVAARALWAPWPVLEDVDLHVSAKGVLPHLMTEGSVRIGDGRARFSGPISFEHGFRADIGVDAQNVRPSAFVEGAPKTKVSTSGKVTMGAPDGEPFTGTIDATTAPFVIQGVEIAGGSIEAKFDGAGAVGKMFVHDEALPSVLEFGVHPDAAKGQVVVDLDWSANARDIGGVPWLASLGHGRAKWHAKGRIVGGELDARFDATAHHLSLPSLVLEQGNLSGSVRGPLDELALDADLRGRDLSLGPLRFPDVRASASGPLSRLTVQTSLSGEVGPKLSGTGTVRTTTQGTRLEAVTIAVSRDNVVLSGSAKSLEIAEDRVELHDVAIEGAGEPIRGSLTLAPSRLSARLSSGHLDLKKLGLVLLPEAKLEGRVAFDVDASFLGKEERGHLRASVEDGSVLGVAGVSLHVEAAVDQRRFTGGASVRVGELGALTVTASDAELFGPMLRASSWQNATGKLQIDATAFLDALKKQVPLVFGPLLEVGGALRTKVLLSREDIEAHRKHAQAAQGAPSPDIDAIVWTDGLRFEMGDRKSVVDVHPLPS